jgi:hypothetical protein
LVASGGVDDELRRIRRNMQGFIDEEVIMINGERVSAKVSDVFLGFRGSWSRPYLEIHVEFRGRLRRGLNIYEDLYEEEIAEYDYEILWIFPRRFRVIDYEMAGEGSVRGNLLRVMVRRGIRVGGGPRGDKVRVG